MADTETLIQSRLLMVEERPLQQVRKRVNALQNLLVPKDKSTTASSDIDFAKMREEIELDFEAFDAQIIRLQLTMDTNAREVERYEAERTNINTANARAREAIAQQREELELVKLEKQNRLEYDTFAADILNSKSLRPRDEQEIAIARLNDEIEALKAEKAKASAEQEKRNADLTKIHEELQRMLREIKEDKEEQERMEGMDEEEEGEEVESIPLRMKDGVSGGNTPMRPPIAGAPGVGKSDTEGGKTPRADEKGSTPAPSSQGIDIIITDAPPVDAESVADADKMDTT